jgi:hypothetical protein
VFDSTVEESLTRTMEANGFVSVRFRPDGSENKLRTVIGRLQSFGTDQLVIEKRGPISTESITEIWIGGETVFSRSGA